MSKTPSVAPKERVNITYQSAIQAAEQIELPLKMLLLGEFSPNAAHVPLEARSVLSLDKDNFDVAMASQQLVLQLSVPNHLAADTQEDMAISLNIKGIRDFEPDRLIKQAPQLSQLMALRNALITLKGPLGNIPAFTQTLRQIVHDPKTRERLVEQLHAIDGVGEQHVD